MKHLCRVALGALLASLLLFWTICSILWSFPQGRNLWDFGSFIASGRAIAEGRNPHGVYPLTYHVSIPSEGLEVECPNLNLPISLLLFEPLSGLEPLTAFRGWYIASAVLYILVLALLARAYPRARSPWRLAWALSLAGLWHTLRLGQIYMPLVLAATVAWLLMERGRHWTAGVLIGLVVAFKPNFAVWPGLLLLAGHWPAAVSAFITAGVISIIPVVAYGPQVYVQWLEMNRSHSGELVLLPGNGSLAGLTARLDVLWLGPLLAVVLLLAVAAWALHKRPSAMRAGSIALVVSLLASPLAWSGYGLFLLPVLIGRKWSLWLRIGALMLAFPIALDLLWLQRSPWHLLILGSVYGWALLLILLGLGRETAEQSCPSDWSARLPRSTAPAAHPSMGGGSE